MFTSEVFWRSNTENSFHKRECLIPETQAQKSQITVTDYRDDVQTVFLQNTPKGLSVLARHCEARTGFRMAQPIRELSQEYPQRVELLAISHLVSLYCVGWPKSCHDSLRSVVSSSP